jgi:hypothetical protein
MFLSTAHYPKHFVPEETYEPKTAPMSLFTIPPPGTDDRISHLRLWQFVWCSYLHCCCYKVYNLQEYVDTWIRTNRTFQLHSFNTKWPTVHFSLLTLADERQQYIWVITVTRQELNITGWKVKIIYRDDILLLYAVWQHSFISKPLNYICAESDYTKSQCMA